MDEDDWLGKRFDENRARLQAVAYRMLGSASEAEDALQETWLKLSRSETETVENLGGWLTTVLVRVCLDMLRTRRSRREDPLEAAPETLGEGSPEDDLALADATGQALLIVLETLVPAERVAFVLHDLFDLSFAEIARILERTPVAVRQLASRARRRVRGTEVPPADLVRHRELVGASLSTNCGRSARKNSATLGFSTSLRNDCQRIVRPRTPPATASTASGRSLRPSVLIPRYTR
jgi:RNA polymerase sigma-70 factor (ECF subfamily)